MISFDDKNLNGNDLDFWFGKLDKFFVLKFTSFEFLMGNFSLDSC